MPYSAADITVLHMSLFERLLVIVASIVMTENDRKLGCVVSVQLGFREKMIVDVLAKIFFHSVSRLTTNERAYCFVRCFGCHNFLRTQRNQ